MKTLSTNPRVLLCTTYQRFLGDYCDVADYSMHRSPKLSTSRRASLGLRFIKQNVPEVEILEYPLWDEYVAKLKEGWDVVGFSFHNIELDEIQKMTEEARHQGVSELWAGSFGALDDRVPSLVDRIFVGPAEDQIAQVFGYRVPNDEIEHPPVMVHVKLSPGRIRFLTAGILYSQYGCPFNCKYCQTTVFHKECFTLNLESIDRVLRYYKKIGISYIIPLDETFGANPEFTDQVVELFASYKFNWWAQTRVGTILHRLDNWYKRGLRVAGIGVESMNQETLDAVDKQQKVEEVIEYAQRSKEKRNMARVAYYQMGFPDMTADEIIQDAMRLSKLEFDLVTVGVFTPHPKTSLWKEIESKYGIFDHTSRHYNNITLMWNHPYISPTEMTQLRGRVLSILNKPGALSRLLSRSFLPRGLGSTWRNLVRGPISSIFINDRKQVFFPKIGNDKEK